MNSCGLYIHVPFCLRKCNYCDFVSFGYSEELAEEYMLALFSELNLIGKKYNHPQLQTIYLGGGTPTCLKGGKLAEILKRVKKEFPVLSDAEITCEVNPATVSLEDFEIMFSRGFNRLSIGVQSFDQDLLHTLGRIHDLDSVYQTFEIAKQAGFTNLNLDLIFAIPGQSQKDWQNSLHKALQFKPQHLSLYNLKIEEGTPFYHEYQEGRLVPVDEELDLWMYEEAISTLTKAGYQHYEISNFARPGMASRHNLTYWHYKPFLAVGPGAHGFDGTVRYENTADLQKYITSLSKAQLPWQEVIELTKEEQMDEFLMMGLRLLAGVSLTEFTNRFGFSILDRYGEQIERLTRLGLLELKGDNLTLTDKGIPLGNDVFAEFIL